MNALFLSHFKPIKECDIDKELRLLSLFLPISGNNLAWIELEFTENKYHTAF